MKRNRIICGDAFKELPKMQCQSVDCVITDPPYNASNSKIDIRDKSYKSIDEEWDKGFSIDYVYDIFHMLKDNGSV